MYMRLAFSVAINVDADILLIDEILAVGDVAFQAKCFNKLREIKRNGTTIVIVSHSLGQIEQICDRSYWIEGGLIREEGNPVDVHQKYLRFMSERTGTLSEHHEEEQTGEPAPQTSEASAPEVKVQGEFSSEDGNRWGSNDIVFRDVWLENEKGERADRLECGRPFRIVMPYEVIQPVDEVVFGIGIFRNDGLQCYGTNTDIEHITVNTKDKGCVVCDIRYNALLEGRYWLDIAIHKPDGFAYDYCRSCLEFSVFSIEKDAGVMRLKHEWHID